MFICHASDIHGNLKLIQPLPNVDCFVLSGDIAPNMRYPRCDEHRRAEYEYQAQWYREQATTLQQLFEDKPVLVVDGNHDFYPVHLGLEDAKINVRRITPSGIVLATPDNAAGLMFAGFPDIPYIAGDWNHESSSYAIQVQCEAVLMTMPDVLVTHAPPHHVLDNVYGEHVGSPEIRRLVLEDMPNGKLKAHLFGHIHEGRGTCLSRDRETRFYNSACGSTNIAV